MFVRKKPNKSGKVSVQVLLKSKSRKQQVVKTIDYLERYLHVRYDVSKIYRFLDNLCYRKEDGKDSAKEKPEEPDFKHLVENISFDYTKRIVGGDISVCFYDITTLYWETEEEDDLRKCGFSKDGKHSCPQIFLGLLVAAGGNPIGYEIYEGNISEGKTIIPVVKALAERFGFSKPIIIADAGLLSRSNIAALVDDGYKFILGARPKSESSEVKERILALGMKDGDVCELDKDKTSGTRLILSRTEKRKKKDEHNRRKGLERLRKKLGYTILLELERQLKAAKSEITVYRAQELTKNMYAICYNHPKSKVTKEVALGMDEEQRELCQIVEGKVK